MRTMLLSVLTTLAAIGVSSSFATENSATPAVLNFTMKSLSGEDLPLSKFQGKVILMINVASKCGYTPQYAGLQALYAKYQDKGLVLLGFPSNNFGKQEPGTGEEIAEFCKLNYGVSFPLFSKVEVKGDAKVALYKYLTDPANDPSKGGEIKWNFEKFLISKDGKIVHRWRSSVTPQSDEVVKAVEAELAK